MEHNTRLKKAFIFMVVLCAVSMVAQRVYAQEPAFDRVWMSLHEDDLSILRDGFVLQCKDIYTETPTDTAAYKAREAFMFAHVQNPNEAVKRFADLVVGHPSVTIVGGRLKYNDLDLTNSNAKTIWGHVWNYLARVSRYDGPE